MFSYKKKFFVFMGIFFSSALYSMEVKEELYANPRNLSQGALWDLAIRAIKTNDDKRLSELRRLMHPDTLFHIAVENGDGDAARSLIRKCNIDPNSENYDFPSKTALMVAAAKGSREMVETLLDLGANKKLLCKTIQVPSSSDDGSFIILYKSASDFAAEQGHTELAEFLKW